MRERIEMTLYDGLGNEYPLILKPAQIAFNNSRGRAVDDGPGELITLSGDLVMAMTDGTFRLGSPLGRQLFKNPPSGNPFVEQV